MRLLSTTSNRKLVFGEFYFCSKTTLHAINGAWPGSTFRLMKFVAKLLINLIYLVSTFLLRLLCIGCSRAPSQAGYNNILLFQ